MKWLLFSLSTFYGKLPRSPYIETEFIDFLTQNIVLRKLVMNIFFIIECGVILP